MRWPWQMPRDLPWVTPYPLPRDTTDALLAGNVDIGVVWSGEAALCWQENHKFAYILPADGARGFGS